MPKLNDLTGKKFGKLTVIKRVANKNGKVHWLCKCDCGNYCTVTSGNLITKTTTSCGCFRLYQLKNKIAIHNMSNTRLYKIWLGIKCRCYNKNHHSYINYGDRGITMCNKWKNDFMSFYNWAMQNGYKDDLTIDRIDFNGNYEPSNCRWITLEAQSKNKRNTIHITYKNKTLPLADWAKLTDIKYCTLLNRYHKNWNVDKMFNNYSAVSFT